MVHTNPDGQTHAVTYKHACRCFLLFQKEISKFEQCLVVLY